jgi:type II secretory pathway component HofQ
VSTVGTDPYIGPLPEELTKLAQVEAAGVTSPTPAKAPETTTITKGGPTPPTAAELAKLAALPANPDTLPVPVMPKLELMNVPKEGTPELTTQEREKHARELASPHVITMASPTGQVRSGDSPAATDSTSVRIQRQIQALKGMATPAAPQPAASIAR